MKKIIFLFLCVYTFSFSVVDFENLRWNDKVFDIMLAYPGVHKEESFQNGIEIYSLDDPEPYIKSYNFYLVDGSLYKIDMVFDPEQVDTTSKIRDVYNNITSKFGDPLSKEPISQDLITTKLTGNSQTFKPDSETIIFFKGIDTLNKEGEMIDSTLLLEYRNIAKLNVYP